MIRRYTYELVLDTDTGKILDCSLTGTADCDDPTATLEDNRLRLNDDAVSAMGVKPGTKMAVRFDGTGPVIGTSTAFGVATGYKLTSMNTFTCKGKEREELASYGTEFKVVPKGGGLFALERKDDVSFEDLDGLADSVGPEFFKL